MESSLEVNLFDFMTILWGSVAECLERRIWNAYVAVQIPFWPLVDVVLGSPDFNFSATLVNNQLVCLLPVEILKPGYVYLNIYLSLSVFIGSDKPNWEWPITYTYHITQLGWTARVPHAGFIVGLNRGLDYQPLFGKRAHAPPHERTAERA